MRVLIHVEAVYRGFLASLALHLQDRHEVVLLARNPDMQNVLERMAVGFSGRIEALAEQTAVDAGELVETCRSVEASHDIRFAELIAHDRELGKGYLLNAPGHPPMRAAEWPHRRKLQAVLSEWNRYKEALDALDPELIVGGIHFKSLAAIARHRGIPYLALAPARIDDLYYWTENEFRQSSDLDRAIRGNLDLVPSTLPEAMAGFQQMAAAQVVQARLQYGSLQAFRAAATQVFQGVRRWAYAAVKRRPTDRGYAWFAWVKPTLRRASHYRYVARHSVHPSQIVERVVYFPLQLEPEASLHNLSPEFSNSIEAVNWVSKALPADTVLVVKENPSSFGVRSKGYYDTLRRMANVVLSHPSVHSWDWIRRADAVATITGTVGFEGVLFGKPVISFGRHQAINILPTVHAVRCFEEVREAVEVALGRTEPSELDRSSRVLLASLRQISFPLPGFRAAATTDALQPGNAAQAAKHLPLVPPRGAATVPLPVGTVPAAVLP